MASNLLNLPIQGEKGSMLVAINRQGKVIDVEFDKSSFDKFLEKDKGTYHYIQEVFVTEEKLESLKGCSFDEIGGFVFEPVMKQIQSVQIKTSNAMRASETNTYKKAA